MGVLEKVCEPNQERKAEIQWLTKKWNRRSTVSGVTTGA
jgi:hypothetical protein